MLHNQFLVPLYIFGTLLITSFAIIITLFFFVHKRRQVQHILQQQQLRFDYEHSLLRTRIEVQEQVLATLSLDLHDNIGQVLSLGCMQLGRMKGTLTTPEQAGRLDAILQLFKQSVKDLRLLSHSLNTGLIEQRSLEESIMAEFSRIEAFSGIRCFLVSTATGERLQAEQRLLVFRIVQEALQNILKHAEAGEIRIELNDAPQLITLSVSDNGVGFSTDEKGGRESLGLLSMQQRAAFLHAELHVRSAPGQGTTLTLTIPVN